MKEFRKTEGNRFICEECGKTYIDKKNGICHHIYKMHNAKDYFDKWLKEENDDKCIICGNEIKFNNLSHGYNNRCSKKCKNLYRTKHVKESTLNKYGVENVFQLNDVKEKRNNTMKKKYGAEQTSNSELLKEKRKQTFIKNFGVNSYTSTNEFKEKSKQTKLKKYGHSNYVDQKKLKQTKLEKYGDENYNNREKAKQTCLEHFGVENQMQDKEIFEKQQNSAHRFKFFKNTNLIYQGLYEYDFLEKYYDKFPKIKRGLRIKYYDINNKIRYYYSDYYISSLNLIIEIKSSWTLHKNDKQKEKGAVANGFNYIMIIDKNYKDFNILSSS
jgi:hypothetical protein